MTENAKTVTFLGIGLAAVALALLTRPSSADLDVKSSVGEVLTKKFTSPDQAKRLRILRVDEGTATRNTFEVAEKNGLWTIPSKDDYPADATKQMAEAATGLMDRKILEVATENAGEHSQFGVIDPLGKVDPGQKGVGTRVTVSDAQEQPLIDLIIGKEVKEFPGKRYVRMADQPVVYAIEFDPSHLSTKFEDWIEKDLLKLSTLDIQEVDIKDYSAQLVPAMTPQGLSIQLDWNRRAEMALGYSDQDSKWSPLRLAAFDKDKKDYVEFKLADDEELNTKALNDMKTALDDLKIVDVARKPQGLSQDLKAGKDFLNNREAIQDLMTRGFAPTTKADGSDEIISNDGEVTVTLKNGTEYVLRFGELAQVDHDAQKAGDEAAKAEKKAEGDKGGVHRYLFAMARFNEAAIKKPELQDLPALPAGAETPAATGEGAAASGQPATATESANPTQDQPADPPKSPQDPQDPAAVPQGNAETKQEATPPAADAGKQDAATKTETTEKDAALDKIIAERRRIEAENQRKLDDYQAAIKKGRETVKDLNLRFGDWYFVIDNEVFTKIRLGRDQVVKKKEAKADADGKKENESALGAPGTMIPGLPQLPGMGGDKAGK